MLKVAVFSAEMDLVKENMFDLPDDFSPAATDADLENENLLSEVSAGAVTDPSGGDDDDDDSEENDDSIDESESDSEDS